MCGFSTLRRGSEIFGQNPAHRGLSSVLQYDDRDEVWDLLNCYAVQLSRNIETAVLGVEIPFWERENLEFRAA